MARLFPLAILSVVVFVGSSLAAQCPDMGNVCVGVNVEPTNQCLAKCLFDVTGNTGCLTYWSQNCANGLKTILQAQPSFCTNNNTNPQLSNETRAICNYYTCPWSNCDNPSQYTPGPYVTTANPTSGNPTSGNPTSGNPTSGNPTSANPTSANPTSGNPTSGVEATSVGATSGVHVTTSQTPAESSTTGQHVTTGASQGTSGVVLGSTTGAHVTTAVSAGAQTTGNAPSPASTTGAVVQSPFIIFDFDTSSEGFDKNKVLDGICEIVSMSPCDYNNFVDPVIWGSNPVSMQFKLQGALASRTADIVDEADAGSLNHIYPLAAVRTSETDQQPAGPILDGTESSDDDDGLGGGAIAGIVIGCIVGVVIIAAIIILLSSRDKKKDKEYAFEEGNIETKAAEMESKPVKVTDVAIVTTTPPATAVAPVIAPALPAESSEEESSSDEDESSESEKSAPDTKAAPAPAPVSNDNASETSSSSLGTSSSDESDSGSSSDA